jgi:hypothetical protein
MRDTSLSSVEGEKDGNNGAAEKLKLKGPQEFVLFDIDLSPLKGKEITGALLHVRSASPVDGPLARVGVSTIAAEWKEGSSSGYRPQTGSACFSQAGLGRRNWSHKGSTVLDVVFGRGNTIWKFGDCSAPDKNGWQSCPVDPDVVAARVAGLSHGFCLYDEVGSTWSLKGGKFSYNYFPNRLFYSRESGSNAPWLEVWTRPGTYQGPTNIQSLSIDTGGLPGGEVQVSWKTPEGRPGGNRILGFSANYDIGGIKKAVSQYLLPMAGRAGEEVKMRIRDTGLLPGQSLTLSVAAVDILGNKGKFSSKRIDLPKGNAPIRLKNDIQPFPPNAKLPTVAGLKISVVDALDKIDPVSGNMVPFHAEGYKGGNHIYSAERRLIRLQGARNETVAFQLNLEGSAEDVRVDYVFGNGKLLKPKISECAYVSAGQKQNEPSMLPDPLVPYSGSFSIPSKSVALRIPGQKNHSLICEVYVSHNESPGRKKGRLTVRTGGEKLDMDVELTVWNFTLPNKLSFVPEMNAYGGVSPYKGYEYYRLAHEHRTCLNRVPYGWNGLPEFAPSWKGDRFEWSGWDRKVGPLLDGSAFADLPRSSEPVDVFYLPFSENWPLSVSDSYSPSYWAEEAFSPEYSEGLKKAFRMFVQHAAEKNWTGTEFQFYLNNKIYYRKDFKGSTAPWIFDEPVNTQDFWALRWYGLLWQSVVSPFRDKIDAAYRADISFPEFSRNILWGVTDAEYIGDNNVQKVRMKEDERLHTGAGRTAEYGTANRIEDPNTQPVIWSISAWTRGASGVLPWQTLGNSGSWNKADQTALFYPHPEGPMPSLRLKAFTRGQQDVEYLTLLVHVTDSPRYALGEIIREAMDVEGKMHRTSPGDAGTLTFVRGKPGDLWRLRYGIARIISAKKPAYRRALVPGNRLARKVGDVGYVSPSPANGRLTPHVEGTAF